MSPWRTKWVKEKSNIALRLSTGECGGSYAEAAIILCSILSVMAAEVWPGRGIDRKRFVELLKVYPPANLHTATISIPLFIGYLRRTGKDAEKSRLEESFMKFDSSRVLTGYEVDKLETEILAVCNTLSMRELRKCSYANLLYEEIRSGYAHEYQPAERADSWTMTQQQNVNVSYVNWVDDPDRHIYFHLLWISQLAVMIAEETDKVAQTIPMSSPSKWWIEG